MNAQCMRGCGNTAWITALFCSLIRVVNTCMYLLFVMERTLCSLIKWQTFLQIFLFYVSSHLRDITWKLLFFSNSKMRRKKYIYILSHWVKKGPLQYFAIVALLRQLAHARQCNWKVAYWAVWLNCKKKNPFRFFPAHWVVKLNMSLSVEFFSSFFPHFPLVWCRLSVLKYLYFTSPSSSSLHWNLRYIFFNFLLLKSYKNRKCA